MTIKTLDLVTRQVIEDGQIAPSFPDIARSQDGDLSPSEFEYLLAYTGLEDIWYSLEQNYKPSDRAKYAFLRGLRKKQAFTQGTTLQLVAQFRPAAAAINPDLDLSDTAIKAAWTLAINSGV